MFDSVLSAVLYYADITPDKLCIADDRSALTYSEYADTVKKYASCLAERGIKKGDYVVTEACQSIEYLAIELALQLIGAIFVPVEHNCGSSKIGLFAKKTNAKMIISVKDPLLSDFTCITYEGLLECFNAARPMEVTGLPGSDDVSEILFSTGTTGKEKGIILTHKNDIALAQNVMYGVEMEKDNVEMIPSPMNHSHGLRRYYANMYNGCSVVILGSVMNMKLFFDNMDRYGVTAIDLVPAAASVVIKLSKNKLADYKDKLRYIQFGAAPMPEQDKARLSELLPNTRLYNFYGSTESGCTCLYNFNTVTPKAGCIGKPTCNTEFIIVNDDREPISSSEANTGIIATKGDMNMLGYWQDKEETESVLENGIIYSNDIGYIDEDGEVILLGRKGDVINVGGNKVSPEEIESTAKLFPSIADCGCIPVEDSAKGFVPKLFVQMKRGEEFDSIKIRSFIASRLEPYKVPVYIVETEKIPRSYNGKLLRKELK